jgi:hypothetical protein
MKCIDDIDLKLVQYCYHLLCGARGSLVVKVLGYKVADPRPAEVKFQIYLVLPAALGFIQPLQEMSTRNIKKIMFLGSKVWPMRGADNLTTICEPIV